MMPILLYMLKWLPLLHAVLTLSDNLSNELEQLLDWFEDNYIGRRNRRGAGLREPMFTPNIWNVYHRTLNGEDRRYNHAEATHRHLQTEFDVVWNVYHRTLNGEDRRYNHAEATHRHLQTEFDVGKLYGDLLMI
ncbi:hypothetical protein QE152_g36705 [Popillia japonica]|uniref:Uncharacterized protein n=1 Tax=Popillia japonica TaxID=7064 RepID=A0AAW1ICG6_POPJA